MIENDIGTKGTEAAICVHRELGPSLLKSVEQITRCVNGLEEPERLSPRNLRASAPLRDTLSKIS